MGEQRDETMSNASSAYQQYQRAEVGTLSQRDLIVKLYRGSEKFMRQGILAIRNNQYELCNDSCQKAKRIFMELLSTLNYDAGGEIAERLRDLYLFFASELVQANIRKEADRLERLLPIVESLREGWEQVPDEMANVSSLDPGNDGHSLNMRM